MNQRKIGVLLSYLVIALNMLIGILYTPFLIRCLGQSEYGLYSILYSIVSYLTIMDMGFGNAIIIYTSRFISQNDKDKQEKLHGMFFLVYCVIGVIATFIGIVLYFNVENIFSSSMTLEEILKAKKMMIILIINLAVTFPLSIFGNILTAYEKFVINKLIKIAEILLQPLIMIPLLILGYKAISMVTVITLINIFCLLLNMIVCVKKLDIKLKFKGFDVKLLKEIFRYSFYIFLAQIVDKINWSLDQFILGAICGTIITAIYAVSSHLNSMYMSFSMAISNIMLPKVTKMEESKADEKEFTDIFIKTGRIQYILLALIITGFILYGKAFINLWVGPGYESSYTIACILMIPITIPLIQNIGISILQAKNLHKFRTIIYFTIAIINIIISIPLSIHYGAIGAAIGTSLSLIIGNIIIINIYYYKKIKIDILKFWKNILSMTISILPAIVIGIILNKLLVSDTIIYFCIKVIIYTLVYAIFMWLFAMNNYEKGLITKPFKKIFSR